MVLANTLGDIPRNYGNRPGNTPNNWLNQIDYNKTFTYPDI